MSLTALLLLQGTRDGDRIRQLVDQGKLVPLELTVNVLVNAMIAEPSQNYLIDGFPRAVEQATYFETNVLEAQNVIFYDVDEETAIQRCLGRGTGRSDDNKESIATRFQKFNETSKAVIDFYNKFGKVRTIDGNRDPVMVYECTRKAMLPQVFCMIGPKASGKTTLGDKLCERTNMKLIDFDKFVTEHKLGDQDEETVTMALIRALSNEISPRVLLENFPQSEFQAKFFCKNCVKPSAVFSLKCSKDVCQERMTQQPQGECGYQSSAILAKKIRLFNENSVKLLPYLQASTNLKCISSEQILETSFEQLSACVEPNLLLVRKSGNDYAEMAQQDIIKNLCASQGYTELNVHSLIAKENERHTEIGSAILELVSAGKPISNNLITAMLRKIIYSGVEGQDKFILTDFPDSKEQCMEFEATCAKIKAIIYASGDCEQLEIEKNDLSGDNIEGYFKKTNRLTHLHKWDEEQFKESLGARTDWILIRGQEYSGTTLVATITAAQSGAKVINWNAVADAIRPRLETEDGPFEGRVPDAEVEKDVKAVMAADKAAGDCCTYVFENFYHESVEAGLAWLCENFGAPSTVITCKAEQKEIEGRWREAKEMGPDDEIGEEDKAALDEANKKEVTDLLAVTDCAAGMNKLVTTIETGVSKEALTEELRQIFCAKVVIVNHERRLTTDVVCANLAIKYNMLYLSVPQVIKQEIECNSEMGKELLNSKKPKALGVNTGDELADDGDLEKDFSAVHFD